MSGSESSRRLIMAVPHSPARRPEPGGAATPAAARIPAPACWSLIALLLGAAPAPGAPSGPPDDEPARPNVVIILADDFGWADIASNNPDSAMTTPNIDSIAAAGIRFTDAHSPSSACSPTRYGLLTGRYAWRTWLTKAVLGGYDRPMIAPGTPTLGTLFQDHGYGTAVVGKWHVGMDFDRLTDLAAVNSTNKGIDYRAEIQDGPLDHGFDEFFGTSGNLGWRPHVYIRNRRFAANPDEDQNTGSSGLVVDNEALDRLTTEAVAFIERAAESGSPFFLYLPVHAVHTPLAPSDAFAGSTGLGDYADLVAQLDSSVGQVLGALEQAGARDNTLVIFSADNGSRAYPIEVPNAPDHRPNGPWSGWKGQILEGGHRVPLVVQWPGVIAAGSTSDATVSLIDVYRTMADILGHTPPAGVARDSVSLLPLLRGEVETRGAPVVHHAPGGRFAVREGRWKLILDQDDQPQRLFDLEADPGETVNLHDDHPEVVTRLEAALDRIRSADDGARSSDATLRSLNVAGIEIGPFSGAVTTYAATARFDARAVYVTAIPNDTDSVVRITSSGWFQEEGRGIGAVWLGRGTTEFSAVVTAPDGAATQVYTVSVTRAETGTPTFAATASPETITEGESATLTVAISNGLTLDEDRTLTLAMSGTASPADYTLTPATLTLPAGTSSVTAQLTALTDTEQEGPETATVAVLDRGLTLSTATVTITSVSRNANLGSLSLSGMDIGTFSAETTGYAASVGAEVASTTVTAAADAEASVAILPADADPGTPGHQVSLAAGANVITVTVTAADGVTARTYTAPVTRAPPLTASFGSVPESHDGETPFAFELRFSEEVAVSYATLRDTAFTVTGGAVRGAQRLAPPSNRGWRITVEPNVTADVVVVLPGTADCAAAGAVCTSGGRPLSHRLEAVVPGPDAADLPVVSVSAVSARVSEAESAQFRLTRTGSTDEELAVAVGGTWSDGTEASVQRPRFLAGRAATTAGFRRTDNEVSGERTLTVRVEEGTGYAVSAAAGSAVVVVEDDDAAVFAVSVEPAEVPAGGTATLRVSIGNGVTFAEAQTLVVEASSASVAMTVQAPRGPGEIGLAAGASAATAELWVVEGAAAEEVVTLTVRHGGRRSVRRSCGYRRGLRRR